MNKENIDNKISEYIDRADAIIGSNQIACKRDLGSNAWVEIAKMIQKEEHNEPTIEFKEVLPEDKHDETVFGEPTYLTMDDAKLKEFMQEKNRMQELLDISVITDKEFVNHLRDFMGLEPLENVAPNSLHRRIIPRPRPTPNPGQAITKGIDFPEWIFIVAIVAIVVLAILKSNCILGWN